MRHVSPPMTIEHERPLADRKKKVETLTLNDEISKMFALGRSPDDIALELGVSVNKVMRRLDVMAQSGKQRVAEKLDDQISQQLTHYAGLRKLVGDDISGAMQVHPALYQTLIKILENEAKLLALAKRMENREDGTGTGGIAGLLHELENSELSNLASSWEQDDKE